jgi:hypothetical protein
MELCRPSTEVEGRAQTNEHIGQLLIRWNRAKLYPKMSICGCPGRFVGYSEVIQFDGLSPNRRLRADDTPLVTR